MMKPVVLALFVILVVPTKIFANQCAIALSHPNVERIKELPNEWQDMILMASLIAPQLQSTSTIQINLTLMFLGAITEVKIDNEDQGIFHNFSLIDGILFTFLKRLGILEDIRAFLLSQLGLSENNLGPFSIRYDGGLTLHLNTPPTLSTITHFNYDEETKALLDIINKSTIQNTQEGSPQNPSTFSEHLLLAALELNTPLRAFLFDVLNTQDAIEVRSILYSLFDNIRQTVKSSNGLFHQLVKGLIIQEAIGLFRDEENITISEMAKRLQVNEGDLQQWLDEHKEK